MITAQGNLTSLKYSCRIEGFTGRIDRFLSEQAGLFTRSQYKNRILVARVNSKSVKPASIVRSGDYLDIVYNREAEISLIPEDISLNILYEDENILVVNKKRGIIVHPGAGNPSGTVVNAFLHHLHMSNKLGFEISGKESLRPGIVHRLDKETTGVLILAKNSPSLEFLAEQFRKRKVKKCYFAIVEGEVKQAGKVAGFIRRNPVQRKTYVYDAVLGKSAETRYIPLQCSNNSFAVSTVRLEPKTGRTHQLRVHCRHLGHPILGDIEYKSKHPQFPLMLHAYSLGIALPGTGIIKCFTASLPQDMLDCLSNLGLNSPDLAM